MAQKKNSGRTHERAGLLRRNASSTKKGPGRYHSDGTKKMKNRKKA